MTISRRTFVLFALLAALMPVGFARGADTKNDAKKEELKRRFEQRLPEIRQLKKAGTIGETYQGYLDVREGKDKPASRLVDEENADRKELYNLIAKETDTTADVVAERAAKRNFEKAKPGEYLKGEDGKWKKKE